MSKADVKVKRHRSENIFFKDILRKYVQVPSLKIHLRPTDYKARNVVSGNLKYISRGACVGGEFAVLFRSVHCTSFFVSSSAYPREGKPLPYKIGGNPPSCAPIQSLPLRGRWRAKRDGEGAQHNQPLHIRRSRIYHFALRAKYHIREANISLYLLLSQRSKYSSPSIAISTPKSARI